MLPCLCIICPICKQKVWKSDVTLTLNNRLETISTLYYMELSMTVFMPVPWSDTVPSFKLWSSLDFVTSCCVICSYAMVQAMGIFMTLETSLICILLSASRDVHFDKRMICFLSGLFKKHIIAKTTKKSISCHHVKDITLLCDFKSSLYVILWYAFMNRLTV